MIHTSHYYADFEFEQNQICMDRTCMDLCYVYVTFAYLFHFYSIEREREKATGEYCPVFFLYWVYQLLLHFSMDFSLYVFMN